MSFLSTLSNALSFIPNKKAFTFPAVPIQDNTTLFGYSGISLYPHNTGDSYIKNGYNKNAQVYAIVSKNSRKLGQVNFYHYRIKNSERKTWSDYLRETKNGVTAENIRELKKMRQKSIDENKVDSDLSKLLKKPNRYQTGAIWREQLYGYKQLTGEGNIWINQGESGKEKPKELLIIPKAFLQLIMGNDPWQVDAYQFNILMGKLQRIPKEQVIMWIYPNYEFSSSTLSHLRGQSPLDSGLLLLQASNVAAERLVKMNDNQGAAGLLYRTDPHTAPTPTQAASMRQQINETINSQDMAGAIAWLTGQYGYLQFGLDAEKLKLIEQSEASFEALCNIFDIPPGIFAKDQTYENVKEAKRNWVYDNIAPAAYSLRDELNEKLIIQMGLDRDRDFIDCDILSLPEMSMDLGKQIAAIKDAYWTTLDEKRTATGYEALNTEESKKIYVQSSLTTLEEINAPTGGNLDSEMNLLEEPIK